MSEVENQGIAQNDGIKEVIYQIFDSVIPAETGNVAFGINDFQEIGEQFRKMVDMAVNEHDETVSTYINVRIEALNTANNELHVQLIEKDAQLQEAARKLQAVFNDYEQSLKDNRRLEDDFSTISNENASLKQRIVDLADDSTDKGMIITDLQDQLKAKDEQIAKLTEEINKPKSSIILPSGTKKSATLSQMMEEARNKTVKSQMDLALTGQTFRGKVELTVPPVGGSNDSLSFLDEDPQPIIENDRISVPEATSVDFREEEESNNFGLDMAEHETVRNDDAPATLGELKALEARLEARIVQIEQSQRSVA